MNNFKNAQFIVRGRTEWNFPSIYFKESQNFDFYQNRINSPE